MCEQHLSQCIIAAFFSVVQFQGNIPKDGSCRLELNLKPGLTPEQLDKRIQRDCTAHPNQAMGTIFRGLLPLKLVPVFLEAVHIPPETKANALTKEQRRILVQGLQAFPLHITARRSLKEAIITRGGVSVREVQAKGGRQETEIQGRRDRGNRISQDI